MSQPSAPGHSRTKSQTKPSRPRSSTKGPLDASELPLPIPTTSSPAPSPSRNPHLSPQAASGSRSPTSQWPRPPPSPSHARHASASLPKDFSFLLRPEIYHPLTPLNVPAPFRNSTKQPSPNSSLEELLSKGHFRAAAIKAVQELTASGGAEPVDPSDASKIFNLLYVRLACLTLIDATALAAQEVKALEDLNNAVRYVDEATGEHLVQWELRVLNVRLQALGFGDTRRSVMSYYELAREARERVSRAQSRGDPSSAELWKTRLHDLAISIAGALVEMGDLSGAAHHLAGMKDRGDGKLTLARALLWLQIGDADAARECVRDWKYGGHTDGVVLALCDMANGRFDDAARRWTCVREKLGDDEMVGVNVAVCLLYLGRMSEGRDILEGLVDAGRSSHTLLFNLSTMYELCTERNRGLKLDLASRIAGMDESPSGWEKSSADFKL